MSGNDFLRIRKSILPTAVSLVFACGGGGGTGDDAGRVSDAFVTNGDGGGVPSNADGGPASTDGRMIAERTRIDTSIFLPTELLSSLNIIVANGLAPNALLADGLDQVVLTALASQELSESGITLGEVHRTVLSYIYSCAMPAGSEMELEIAGEPWVFTGQVGLAPEWASGACDQACQEWVSACILARTNAFAKPVAISMRGDHPALATTPTVRQQYSLREGSYFGNIFAGPLQDNGFACAGGRGGAIPELTDRFCAVIGDDCPIETVGDCNRNEFACDPTFPGCSSYTACSAWDATTGYPTTCHSERYLCNTTPTGATYNRVVTVYIEPPVVDCGNGICEEGETETCPSAPDCADFWAERYGSGCHEDSGGLAVDSSGNVAVTGRFIGDLAFGGTPLTTSSGSDADLFVAKLTTSGGHVWSRRINTTGTRAMATAIETDSNGNVIIAGHFNVPIDFGDGAVVTPPNGGTSFFVAKYAAATGALQWALPMLNDRDIGDLPLEQMPKPVLAIHTNGNITLASDFQGTIDLGLSQQNPSSDSAFFRDIVVLTISSAGAPIPASIKTIGGPLGEWVTDVAIDSSGKIVLAGGFKDEVDFGRGNTLATSGSSDEDGFVAKLSSSGTLDWAKRIGGSAGADRVNGLTIANGDSVAVTGLFRSPMAVGTTDLTPHLKSDMSTYSVDAFIAKFDAAGNATWAKSYGGVQTDVGYLIDWSDDTTSLVAALQTGGCITPLGESSCPSPVLVEGHPIDAGEFDDIVLIELSPTGTARNVAQRGSPVREWPRGLVVQDGDIVMAGEFMGTVRFSGRYLTNRGGSDRTAVPADLFIARMRNLGE